MRVYHFLSAHYALKTLYEHRMKISIFADMNDPFELSSFNLENVYYPEGFATANRQISDTMGVLCFSRNWWNPVLWAHYSDKHKGICLGFDVPDNCVREVTYISEPLPPPQRREDLTETLVLQAVSTKFEHWRYEDEVRLFTDLKESEGGLYFYDFYEDAVQMQLKEVIVGVRCSVMKGAIDRAVRDYPAPVIIIKARLSQRSFTVIEDTRGFIPDT